MFKNLFKSENARLASISRGQIVPDSSRCVQCGICSYHCPVNIDVRRHAWLGQPVVHSHCISCGECVARCPRGVLKLELTNLSVEPGK